MQWMKEQRDAIGQALDDTRAVLSVKSEARDPLALVTRLSDLARSNSFLSVETSLNIVEHYSRYTHVGRKLSRGLALSALAADLLTGYTVLNGKCAMGTAYRRRKLGSFCKNASVSMTPLRYGFRAPG